MFFEDSKMNFNELAHMRNNMENNGKLNFLLSNYNSSLNINNHKNKVKKFSLNSTEHEMISLSTNYSQSFKYDKPTKSSFNMVNSNNNKNVIKNKVKESKKIVVPILLENKEFKNLTRTFSEPKISIAEFWEKENDELQLQTGMEIIPNEDIVKHKKSLGEKDEINNGTDKSKNFKSFKLGNNNAKKHVSPENNSEILDSPYNNIFFFEYSKSLKLYLEKYVKNRIYASNDKPNEPKIKV